MLTHFHRIRLADKKGPVLITGGDINRTGSMTLNIYFMRYEVSSLNIRFCQNFYLQFTNYAD